MRLFFTSEFCRTFKRLTRKNPKLKRKIEQQIALFQSEFFHRSLRAHKLRGARSEQYSFWIEGNLRIIYIKDDADVIMRDIVTHDEY